MDSLEVDRPNVRNALDTTVDRLDDLWRAIGALGGRIEAGEAEALRITLAGARAGLERVYELMHLTAPAIAIAGEASSDEVVVDIEEMLTALDEPDAEAADLPQTKPSSIPPAPVEAVAFKAGAPRVLVVEDDPDIRNLVTSALATAYTVYQAEDGVRATEILATLVEPPDVIVCDVAMPRLDGLGFARALKANLRLRLVPIIFVSAKDRPLDVVAGINAGGRHYLTKPFKLRDLLGKVAGVLPRR